MGQTKAAERISVSKKSPRAGKFRIRYPIRTLLISYLIRSFSQFLDIPLPDSDQ